ncbi:hypothetical protein K491DRAFT_391971 [Lophiostoma macrostomum CBS 122681]|uniref:Uncharacterized protein n=1 Tax=Lophiostoma macrostomum CBS 122681 TaxID=1314788 RepID=A0A6A6T956_9PLEO|nr:hypothetical protein K491DRAFT_391971 [Lophiostoma macrostomum CBS 122681]
MLTPPNSIEPAMMLAQAYSTADPMYFQEETAWAPYFNSYMTDSMVPANSYQASPLQNCLCSSSRGPCASHFEQIRFQIMSKSVAPRLQLDQQKVGPLPANQQDHVLVPSSSAEIYLDQEKQHNHFVNSSSHTVRPRTASEVSSLRDSVYEEQLPVSFNANETSRSRTSNSDANAEMTKCFDDLLACMRTFGLSDFDATVATYYTANFAANSCPAMAQVASRSRRLKDMITTLKSHSDHWPRHQSRGLHESLLTASTSLCTKEMEMFNGRHECGTRNQKSGAVIEAFEQLLREHGLHLENYEQSSRASADSRFPWEETETGPESMPYLWSLLTGLSGLKGLYCDRVARLVLSILLAAQRMQ